MGEKNEEDESRNIAPPKGPFEIFLEAARKVIRTPKREVDEELARIQEEKSKEID